MQANLGLMLKEKQRFHVMADDVDLPFVDDCMRTSRKTDFRSSKNNFRGHDISRPTPRASLSVLSFSLVVTQQEIERRLFRFVPLLVSSQPRSQGLSSQPPLYGQRRETLATRLPSRWLGQSEKCVILTTTSPYLVLS